MRALLNNLLAGFRLATFFRVDVDQFRVSITQLVWLTLIEFALGIGIGYFEQGAGKLNFNPDIILQSLAAVTFTLAVAALLAHWLRTPALLPGYAVAATAMSPTMLAYLYAGYAIWQRAMADSNLDWIWSLGLLLWLGALLTRAVTVWVPLPFGRRIAVASLLTAALAVQLWGLPRHEAWYPDYAEAADSALKIGGHEALLYRETGLLDHSLNSLQAQRPHVSDLYFVGFAGYGWQDVFMKEMNTVHALFDSRLDTRGRSLALINNAQTQATAPIATTTALQAALKRVGGLLDPEEDVLFLFVTSHGSDDPAFVSVDNNGLQLTQLTPARLKAALAATPIKWKVIVVSACYSGSFIPALRDDNTLVITASRADRNSFGCDARNSMTEFGRAYFVEALKQTKSFTAAFELARTRIAAREKAEGLTPSQPQMALGKSFAAKWRGIYD
ncbi:MAG TPA: C13 family peptidase [Thiobacillus sp.]